MAPDHTLVLVNGRRRHRGAVITWLGNGVADGAQGPDVSTIPGIALRQIEVLRDGAAAQYGSDAIAGVLNRLLKDDRSGGRVEVRSGTHGAGDGRQYAVAANAGLPQGGTGFANLSLEYGNTASTDRSVQRADASRLVAAGNRDVGDPAQQWGSPEVDDDLKLFANLGHLFANGVQAYGHAGYARRDVLTFFYFRNPNTRGGVFSGDGGRTLLVGDVLAARGEGPAAPRWRSPATCPIRPPSEPSSTTRTASRSRSGSRAASRPASAALRRTPRWSAACAGSSRAASSGTRPGGRPLVERAAAFGPLPRFVA